MTDDLAKRLRETDWGDNVADTLTKWDNARYQAADRIEAQAAEIERLRAALRHIARTKIEVLKADHAPITAPFEMPYFSAQDCWEMARAALGDTQ